MGGGSGLGAPRSGVDVMRDQARLRCSACATGQALLLDLRQPEPCRHPSIAAVVGDFPCEAGPLYDRMLVFLQAPAAQCRRCAGRDLVGQDFDGRWGHPDSDREFTEHCERADALERLTERTVTT